MPGYSPTRCDRLRIAPSGGHATGVGQPDGVRHLGRGGGTWQPASVGGGTSPIHPTYGAMCRHLVRHRNNGGG
ncbi:MAG: hypothetical protein ABIS91_11580, partial [Nocardioides sp.]|uniref:hypothetical protein n=1 Tax=Nocardioides sp. TaxID=35761 RepID=UPI0032644DEB